MKQPTDELNRIHISLGLLLPKPVSQDPLLPGTEVRITSQNEGTKVASAWGGRGDALKAWGRALGAASAQ